MKVLLITNLFPNNMEPNRGIFVKQSAARLAKLCELTVVAPVNWFPPCLKRPKGMAGMREIAREETIDGIRVLHPRWFSLPVITRLFNGFLMFFALVPIVLRIKKQFDFDVIYAHWLFPDGFASALLAMLARRPLVLHARGCDLNQYTRFLFRRWMILWSIRRAARLIVVSDPMHKRAEALGVPTEKLAVIRNGVDKQFFYPIDRVLCREEVGLPVGEKIILFVGSFEEVKGIQFLLPAFRDAAKASPVPVRLVMIGKGSLRETIQRALAELSIADRVTLAGEVKHDALVRWLNASDILCLPSIREGLPNVVLEAQACGKPVVATRVGGIPDVITEDAYGFLVEPTNISELSGALRRAIEKEWAPARIIENPQLCDWEKNAEITRAVLSGAALDKRNRAG